jgi:transcriptional regulator with XRE-family HTH domain
VANKSPVAKRLKEARVSAKFSQKGLGIAAGIDEFSSSARMNQYETGKHEPDFLTLKHISRVLKCPVAYFYAEDDDLAEVIRIFHLLNQQNRKKLMGIARKL